MISKLDNIKIQMIEGADFASELNLVPQAYAQVRPSQLPLGPEDHFFITVEGVGSDRNSLEQAKTMAVADADAKLISVLRSEITDILSRSTQSNKENVLTQMFDPWMNEQIVLHGETESWTFSKKDGVYEYSVVKRLPRNVAALFYRDMARINDDARHQVYIELKK